MLVKLRIVSASRRHADRLARPAWNAPIQPVRPLG